MGCYHTHSTLTAIPLALLLRMQHMSCQCTRSTRASITQICTQCMGCHCTYSAQAAIAHEAHGLPSHTYTHSARAAIAHAAHGLPLHTQCTCCHCTHSVPAVTAAHQLPVHTSLHPTQLAATLHHILTGISFRIHGVTITMLLVLCTKTTWLLQYSLPKTISSVQDTESKRTSIFCMHPSPNYLGHYLFGTRPAHACLGYI